MIEYNTKQKPRHMHSIAIGEGKIKEPCDVCYMEASGRELELILTTAPFLIDGGTGRRFQTFTNCEASAAALAFNYTEK